MEIENLPTGTPDSGVKAETQEFVPIVKADDADLENYLEDSIQAAKDDENNTNINSASSETTQPEGKKATRERSDINPDKASEEPSQDDKIKRLQLEKEETTRRLQVAQAYIEKRSGEIGTLRKQLTAAQAQLEAELEDKYSENPKQAVKDQLQIKEIQARVNSLDEEEQGLLQTYEAQRVVSQHLQPSEVDMDAVAECLAEDQLAPEFIAEFRKNPYGVAKPETIIQTVKRAKLHKENKELKYYLRKLYEENQGLKGSLVNKPKELLANIEKNLSSPGTLNKSKPTAAIGASGQVNLATLTDEQLEAQMKALTKA